MPRPAGVGVGSLSGFLHDRINEDEAVAREASRRDEHYVETGAHWRWVNRETDEPIDMNPMLDEYQFGPSLRSVEEFPTLSVGLLPQFAIASADDLLTTVGQHIARHDPARVLAECEAKRRIVAEHPPKPVGDARGEYFYCENCLSDERDCYPDEWTQQYYPCRTLRLLALPYAGHPEYQEAWRP